MREVTTHTEILFLFSLTKGERGEKYFIFSTVQKHVCTGPVCEVFGNSAVYLRVEKL